MVILLSPVNFSLLSGPTSDTLALFLVQVFLILVIVRILGRVLSRLKQPLVIGEIIAGILLGPSALGQIPGFTNAIFPASSLDALSLFASIGLIFFMFFLGLEVEPKSIFAALRTSILIAVTSIVIPFICGSLLSIWLFNLETTTATFTVFLLFLGTALSFTAFPVLARVLTTSDLLFSPVGVQALSCAAVDDLLAWCTLACTLSYANGGGLQKGLYIAFIAIGFVLFLVFPVRMTLTKIHNHLRAKGNEFDRNFLALILLGLCISSWFAEILGIHAFFGAFIYGIIIPKDGELVNDLAPKIELLVVEFFLPLYFANSGIRTQIGALNTGEIWGALIVVIVVGSVAKIVPVMVVNRLVRKDTWRNCLTLGVLMNTRGLVALIVLNIGLDQGILGPKIFALMVVMAIAATFATPPLLWYLYEKQWKEDHPRPTQPKGNDHRLHVTERSVMREEMDDDPEKHEVKPNQKLINQTVDSISMAAQPGVSVETDASVRHMNGATNLPQSNGTRSVGGSTASSSSSSPSHPAPDPSEDNNIPALPSMHRDQSGSSANNRVRAASFYESLAGPVVFHDEQQTGSGGAGVIGVASTTSTPKLHASATATPKKIRTLSIDATVGSVHDSGHNSANGSKTTSPLNRTQSSLLLKFPASASGIGTLSPADSSFHHYPILPAHPPLQHAATLSYISSTTSRYHHALQLLQNPKNPGSGRSDAEQAFAHQTEIVTIGDDGMVSTVGLGAKRDSTIAGLGQVDGQRIDGLSPPLIGVDPDRSLSVRAGMRRIQQLEQNHQSHDRQRGIDEEEHEGV